MELTVQWLDSLGTRADGGWFIVITLITFVNGIWLKMSTDYANFAHRFSMFLLKYMPFRTICRRAWFQWRKLINCNFIKSKHTHSSWITSLYIFFHPKWWLRLVKLLHFHQFNSLHSNGCWLMHRANFTNSFVRKNRNCLRLHHNHRCNIRRPCILRTACLHQFGLMRI